MACTGRGVLFFYLSCLTVSWMHSASGQGLVPAGPRLCEAGKPCVQNCYKCAGGPNENVCNPDSGECHKGCRSGYYGRTCNSLCTSLSSRCTECTQSGTCTACSEHFISRLCTACAQGYFRQGGGCQQCSSNCENRQCNRDTGRCNTCSNGQYGSLCNMLCSPGCARCDRDSGACQACDTNLVLPGCTACAQGYFRQGAGCQQCSSDCENRQCNQDTGRCNTCSSSGRYGSLCNMLCSPGCARCDRDSGACQACDTNLVLPGCTACAQGYFRQGAGCQQCSSDCENRQCNQDTGRCNTCSSSGRYGSLCNMLCSPGCARCDRDSGACQACDTNLVLPGCTSCAQGYFRQGAGCQQCSSDCENRQCNQDTGRCNTCSSSGRYGSLCNMLCSPGCARCDRDSGACQACDTNLVFPGCTACSNGRYGSLCNMLCSPGCARCDRDSGACQACDTNLVFPGCTACAQGYFRQGAGCQQCSSDCENRQCNQDTGRCNTCSSSGRYGSLCNMLCSPGCARCDRDSGACQACDTNLVFPGCTECEDGFFKQSATYCLHCPATCHNSTRCDKTTGHCDECPRGKKGDRCNQECGDGQYGPSRCSLPCGQCEDGQQCHPVTGHCPSCQPGFYPPLCTEACDNKTYGERCSESCGQCKGGQLCDTVTGSCTTGCQPGYTGYLCNSQCQPGQYGEGCSTRCGYCQVNTTCHHQDGRCLGGCVAGFAGPLCLQVKLADEKDNDSLVGLVVGSVIGAAVVLVIGVVGVVCWYCRSRGRPAAKCDTTVTVTDPGSTHGDTSPEPPSSPNPHNDTVYYEISDTTNSPETREAQNIYDMLHPYSNDDADRQPYSQISFHASDVTNSSGNSAFVNTAC